MKTLLRTMYLVGLVLCLGVFVAFPPWFGASYNPDPLVPGGYFEGGTFGLASGQTHALDRAPVWNPPSPHSDIIAASVRWPWQPVTNSAHVEVNVTANVLQLSLGIFGLGLLLWTFSALVMKQRRDAFVAMAATMALAMGAAWMAVVVIAMVSAGFAPVDSVVLTIMVVAAAGGIVTGALVGQASRRGAALGMAGTAGTAGAPGAALDADGSTFVSKVGLFMLGMALALALAFVVSMSMSAFRGPAAGVTELGTTRYARNQTPIDIAISVTIVAAGWAMWFGLRRSGASRLLTIGLAIGATAVGIVLLFK